MVDGRIANILTDCGSIEALAAEGEATTAVTPPVEQLQPRLALQPQAQPAYFYRAPLASAGD